MSKGWIGSLAQIAVSLCVYLTYPLMFYVPVDILIGPAKEKFINFHSFTVEVFDNQSVLRCSLESSDVLHSVKFTFRMLCKNILVHRPNEDLTATETITCCFIYLVTY